MKTQAEYLKKGGENCPVCNNDQIEGGFVDVNEGFADQHMTCSDCGAQWVDSYKLFRFTDVEHDKLVVDIRLAQVILRTFVLDIPIGRPDQLLHLSITGLPDSDRLYAEDQLGYRYKRELPNRSDGLAVFRKI